MSDAAHRAHGRGRGTIGHGELPAWRHWPGRGGQGMWQWMRTLLAGTGSMDGRADDRARQTAAEDDAEAHVRESDPGFVPVRGWIRVERGGLEAVQAAVRDYGGLSTPVRPAVFHIELHAQPDGAVAVVPRDGLPAFDIANLAVWLSAPPDQAEVEGTRVWLSSPGDGLDYALAPELDNPAGDTLVGVRSDGRPVRVFVPDTFITEADATVEGPPAAACIATDRPVALELRLDTDTTFGNPRFVLDESTDEGPA